MASLHLTPGEICTHTFMEDEKNLEQDCPSSNAKANLSNLISSTLPLTLSRHLLQQHYSAPRRPVSTSVLPVRGQHPPILGGVPTGTSPPVQRPALPTAHAGGGVDAHAPPIRLRKNQVHPTLMFAGGVSESLNTAKNDFSFKKRSFSLLTGLMAFTTLCLFTVNDPNISHD